MGLAPVIFFLERCVEVWRETQKDVRAKRTSGDKIRFCLDARETFCHTTDPQLAWTSSQKREGKTMDCVRYTHLSLSLFEVKITTVACLR